MITATANAVGFRRDMNGDGDAADTDPCEDVTYSLYTSGGIQKLGRSCGGGTNQPVAEDIDSLAFVYTLADGSTTASPADLGQIRMIQITLTARTSIPDPSSGRYRKVTLMSRVRPPNL
jgi:hypothetical protein